MHNREVVRIFLNVNFTFPKYFLLVIYHPNQNFFFQLLNLWYCVLILFFTHSVYIRVLLLACFSYGSLTQWGIADLSVKIKVQNILLSALNSGNCLFSRLCKFIYMASGRLSVVDSEIKWLLLSCVNLVCVTILVPFPAGVHVLLQR